MPSLEQIAAAFTVVGGTLALIQLTAIVLRLNRRPKLTLRMAPADVRQEAGRRLVVLHVITTNSGSLSARNILWNYDLPPTFRPVGSEEHHRRAGSVTIARALEHLHPQVETHHEMTIEVPADVNDFQLAYRIHLEDAQPQAGTLAVQL